MTYVGIDVSKATFVVAYSSAKAGKTKTLIISANRYQRSAPIGTTVADESVPTYRSNRYHRSGRIGTK